MKRLLAILLSFAIMCSYAACAEQPSGDDPSVSAVTVDLNAVKDKIVTDLALVDPLEIPAENAYALYTLDPDDVEEIVCLCTLEGAFPDEIIMIKAKNGDAVNRIEDQLEAHLANKINQATNYDADSLALLKECKVEIVGNYVHLFISAKSAQMCEIFEAAKK